MKAMLGNEELEVTPVRIEMIKHSTVRITLVDGTILYWEMLEPEVVKFNDRYDNDGIPIYSITFRPQLTAWAPQSLIRSAK